jgi:hypothetical protein
VRSLTSLAKRDNLLELAKLFDIESSPFPEISGAFSSVVHSISPVSPSKLGEEDMIDRIADVISICAAINDRFVVPYLLWKLVNLHHTRSHGLEEAKGLQMLFKYVPGDHTPLPDFMATDTCKTGLDFHEQCWLRCATLFQFHGYDELGLKVIQMIKDKVVKPLHYYELMPLLLAKEDSLYQTIALCDRLVSNYFLVVFPDGLHYVYWGILSRLRTSQLNCRNGIRKPLKSLSPGR